MGSFNTTCFASGQTIKPDDKCRVVMVSREVNFTPIRLKDQKSDDEYSVYSSPDRYYTNSMWNPVTGWIPMVYDDYGTFTLVDDEYGLRQMHWAIKFLIQNSMKTIKGSNSYHDHPFDINKIISSDKELETWLLVDILGMNKATSSGMSLLEAMSTAWEQISLVSSEGRIFVRDKFGIIVELSHAVMCEPAYNELVSISKNMHQLNRPETIDEFLRACKSNANEVSKRYQLWSNSYNLFSDKSDLMDITDAYFENDISGDEFDRRILRIFENYHVHNGLCALNQFIMPMVYAGQDYDNEIGTMYKDFVNTVCEQMMPEPEDD